MTYANLAVHLDMSPSAETRADIAATLASRFNAHLTGIFAPGVTYPAAWMQVTQAQLDSLEKAWHDAYERTRQRFDNLAHRTGVATSLRWSQVSSDVVGRELALHARYSDLTVVSQPDPDARGGEPLDLGGLGTLVVGAGRPTLVVPYIGPRTDQQGKTRLGTRVMVAWDGGREATRAVNDAMPLLSAAERVDLVVVDPGKDARAHGDEPGADMALHLARHGVEVTVHRDSAPNMGVGDALLSRLADLDSDLLVMGGYAHSRLQEAVMGGATRTVLQHMTVPVLLSH